MSLSGALSVGVPMAYFRFVEIVQQLPSAKWNLATVWARALLVGERNEQTSVRI